MKVEVYIPHPLLDTTKRWFCAYKFDMKNNFNHGMFRLDFNGNLRLYENDILRNLHVFLIWWLDIFSCNFHALTKEQVSAALCMLWKVIIICYHIKFPEARNMYLWCNWKRFTLFHWKVCLLSHIKQRLHVYIFFQKECLIFFATTAI